MSQVLSYELKGLKELEENLRRLKSDVAAKWVNGALLAGTKVIAVKARSNVPVKSGLLRGTIRARRGKKINDDNRRDYYVIAGSRKAGGGGAYYAHMVELGTKSHIITAKNGGSLYFGGRHVGSVKHPGTKAKHFLEGAARSESSSAVNAFGDYIRKKLAKSGLLNPNTETE